MSKINLGFDDVIRMAKAAFYTNDPDPIFFRHGWNGKQLTIHLSQPYVKDGLPFFMFKTQDDKFVPWVASQTDLLASDWEARGFKGD